MKVGDGVSLLLFGPEAFYNDLDFLAVADVLFCDPINDYYYQWKVDGLIAADEDYFNVRGSSFILPAGLLNMDTVYEVRVTIFNNQSEAMASVSRHNKTKNKATENSNK